jgi:AcrR family transcriptional regulator
MRPRARRTNEERSAETRARLLEATIDSLAELGYARTTTTGICDRAGVSRGAQLHHYPTKADLVTAAMAHLFDERDQEFRDAMEKLPAGADRATHAVDLLWSIVSGRTFYAWLELAVAARTDDELRGAMQRLSDRTVSNIQRTFHALFPQPSTPNPAYELAPQFAFALMHGMALEQLVVRDDGRWKQLLDLLKGLSSLVVPPQQGTAK